MGSNNGFGVFAQGSPLALNRRGIEVDEGLVGGVSNAHFMVRVDRAVDMETELLVAMLIVQSLRK